MTIRFCNLCLLNVYKATRRVNKMVVVLKKVFLYLSDADRDIGSIKIVRFIIYKSKLNYCDRNTERQTTRHT